MENNKETLSFDQLEASEKEYLAGMVFYQQEVSPQEKYFFVNSDNVDFLTDYIEILSSDSVESVRKQREPFVKFKFSDNSFSFLFPVMEKMLKSPTVPFIRGLFENLGVVSEPTNFRLILQVMILPEMNLQQKILNSFSSKWLLNETNSLLELTDNNAFDFLGKIYSDLNVSKNVEIFSEYNQRLFMLWGGFIPISSITNTRMNENKKLTHINHVLTFLVAKTREDAILPSKQRATDSGYDLSLLSLKETKGKVELYSTGIKVQPSFGWYFDLVPRSSLCKQGYILANSVGIIDRQYTGEILVPLIKFDESKPSLELPFRAVQLIPRPAPHLTMFHVTEQELVGTERSEKGFGSSGTK